MVVKRKDKQNKPVIKPIQKGSRLGLKAEKKTFKTNTVLEKHVKSQLGIQKGMVKKYVKSVLDIPDLELSVIDPVEGTETIHELVGRVAKGIVINAGIVIEAKRFLNDSGVVFKADKLPRQLDEFSDY